MTNTRVINTCMYVAQFKFFPKTLLVLHCSRIENRILQLKAHKQLTCKNKNLLMALVKNKQDTK